MPVVPFNALNTTALIVPDLYVQLVPPQNLVLNGVPTSTVGLVGTASWGPVGRPVIAGTAADYARAFGPVVARRHDLGTHVAVAVQQGAADFRCVRVSDGTDTRAVAAGPAGCIEFRAVHTGSLGDAITVSLGGGSKAGTWRAVVALPGLTPEVFDNLSGTGNAFWVNLAAAINGGTDLARGPSALVSAVAGAGTTPPAAAVFTLAGGTDGADVDAADLLGTDGATRSGLYALRGQGASLVGVADLDDASGLPAVAAFAQSEGAYAVLAGPPGDTVAAAVARKASAGLDTPAVKLLHGDWLYWRDTVNGAVRLVSPAAFALGRLANLSPEQSSLNKEIYGVVGSQRSGLPGSGQAAGYSNAELQALLQAGIDLITNPIPAGPKWGVRGGRNTSSNAATRGDNHTRMGNYLASTLSAGMGLYVGGLINADHFQNIRSTLLGFLGNMLQQGQLGSTDGSLPYSVQCDVRNNPPARTELGYVQADVQVRYQAINERFLVNLEGGQTVNVSRQVLAGQQ